MEGTQGITIESGVTPIPTAPTKLEADVTAVVEQTSTEKPAEPAESESLEKESSDKSKEEKTKQQENKDEVNEESSQHEEKVDPFIEKKEEIETLFEMLGDRIDEKTKEKIMSDYVDGLLKGNEKEEQKVKMVESLAEMARLLALIFSLLMLAVLNPKPTYSGKDLMLSDTPPEGEKNEKINAILSGENGKKSWKLFKDEVDAIEEVPFGEFMNKVLAANARNSMKGYKPKKAEENSNNPLRKGNEKLGKPGRNARQMKPAAARR